MLRRLFLSPKSTWLVGVRTLFATTIPRYDSVKGKVKLWMHGKGFGFIERDGRDYFVHFNDLSVEEGGYKSLHNGFEVLFDPTLDGEKYKAVNVRGVNGSPLPSGPRPDANYQLARAMRGRGETPPTDTNSQSEDSTKFTQPTRGRGRGQGYTEEKGRYDQGADSEHGYGGEQRYDWQRARGRGGFEDRGFDQEGEYRMRPRGRGYGLREPAEAYYENEEYGYRREPRGFRGRGRGRFRGRFEDFGQTDGGNDYETQDPYVQPRGGSGWGDDSRYRGRGRY